MVFGILSFGLWIYNSYKISKLHSKVGHLERGLNHMIHVLEEQDHTIATLTHSVISLKAVIKDMMIDLQSEEHERNGIKKFSIVSNMITTHYADVSVWGRDSKPSFLENCTLNSSTHENSTWPSPHFSLEPHNWNYCHCSQTTQGYLNCQSRIWQ